MNRSAWTLALVALVGCTASKDEDVPTDETCDTTILGTEPDPGATGVYWRDPLQVTFSEPTDDATFTLTDGTGEVGFSLVSEDDRTWTLGPDAPLEPSTPYTLTVDYCTGAPTVDFTTSAWGEPVADEAGLEGGTWLVSLSAANPGDPLGVALQVVGSVDILVNLDAIDGGSLSMLAALAVGEGASLKQDDCARTAWLPGPIHFDESPWFVADVSRFEFAYEEVVIPLLDVHLEGTFAADGSAIGEVRVRAHVDTRPLIPVFNDDPQAPASAMCDTIADLGVTCEECPDASGPYCVALELVDAEALAVDVPVVELTAEEVAANESCATG